MISKLQAITQKVSFLKILLLIGIIFVICLFFYLDLERYLNIEFFRNEKEKIFDFYSRYPVFCIVGFFCFYVFYTSFSLPGAVLLTLVAGFIFDLLLGVVIVSLGSTIGAGFAFLISRFLLKNYIQKKFQVHLKKINQGFQKDGAFYVFSLRLIPIVPFFVVNSVMGLTSISFKKYILASFVGMLPGTIVYVNAGRQLALIESIKGIVSLPLILSFCFLALLPWIFKWLLKTSLVLKIKKSFF